jgi:hypothetical protein
VLGSEAEFERSLAGLKPLPPTFQSDIGADEREATRPTSTHQKPTGKRHTQKNRSADWWSLGPWARFPYRLFGSGLAAAVGDSALCLYFALLDQANRNGSIRFAVRDKVLAANTGISERTLTDLRKRLVRHGLIDVSVAPGQKPYYELKGITDTDIRPDERPREKGKPRGRSSPKRDEPDKMNILTEAASAPEPDDGWDGLPQNLRGTHAKYARPYAKSAHPPRFFNEG